MVVLIAVVDSQRFLWMCVIPWVDVDVGETKTKVIVSKASQR